MSVVLTVSLWPYLSVVEMDKRQFFIIVSPGFENVAKQELVLLSRVYNLSKSIEDIHVVKGGLLVEMALQEGMLLNYLLKVPTRILLRVAKFRCRDFTKLFKKVQLIDWNSFVGGCDIEWNVSVKNSRLKIQKRISETLSGAFEKYRKGHEPKKNWNHGVMNVFVRIVDDECEISLDTSGDLLHKRGGKNHVSMASIRESIAASLFWFMGGNQLFLDRSIKVVNPMMGVGTFLVEAERLFQKTTTRSFSFLLNPEWQDFTLDKVKCFEKLQLVGVEASRSVAEQAKENFSQNNIAASILVDNFFELEELGDCEKAWFIFNPPYNKRLKIEDKKPQDFYKRIFSHTISKFSPEKVGVIVPQKYNLREIVFRGYKMRKLHFENGGFPVVFILLERAN